MTSTVSPVRFCRAQFDSRTGNLLLSDEKGPVHVAGQLDHDGVRALLGGQLGDLLLSTPAPAESRWQCQIEGEWQFWPLKVDSLISLLKTEDGADSGYAVHVYNDQTEGDRVHVDIQARYTPQGDLAMALTIAADSEGKPSVMVHDGNGVWAGSVDVAPDGTVVFVAGNYTAPAIAQSPSLVHPVKIVVGAFADDDHVAGPMYAEFELDSCFLQRLVELRRLCEVHDLTEVRVADGPDWQRGTEDRRLQCPELVVTADGAMYFEDRPKHTSYVIQTRALDIDELARKALAVAAPDAVLYRAEREVIDAYEEDHCIEDSEG